MSGYVRQSSADILPTQVIRATPINNELNALRDAFAQSGGHKHDGTAAEGDYIPLIADSTAKDKVAVDGTNHRIGLFVNVSGTSTEQVRVQNGAVLPVTTNTVDFGSSSYKFKDFYLAGTATLYNAVATTATIATATVQGGTVNNTVIGNYTPQAITGTLITASTGFAGNLTGDVTGNTTGTHTGAVTGNVTGNLTGNVTASSGSSSFNNVTINGSLDMNASSSATIINLTSPTNSGDAATKGYVDTSISNLVASAPTTLDTLNEIATALGNDPNLASTLTTSIATKLPLAGGTMSGNIAMGTNKITGLGTPTAGTDAVTKTYVDTADALNLLKSGGTMSGAIAMGTNKITGLGDPSSAQDAATKNYIDTLYGSTASAATSAAAAAVSATNAANSASSASTSASTASAAASAAATSYDDFDDRYLGSKASAPSVDNDGNALLTGALYWNSTVNTLYLWTGSAWTQAAFTAGGFLVNSNNLSDVSNPSYALTNLTGFTSTATAGAVTTLTNTSTYYQVFTGTLNQTVQLPVTSTLRTGWSFHLCNNSTGTITVTSSGGNSITVIPSQTTAMVTCIGTTLTTAADWESGLTDFSTSTGSGSVVLGTAPTISTPNITSGLTLTGAAGTAGQALLSQGSGAAPVWGTAGVSAGKAIAFAMVMGF